MPEPEKLTIAEIRERWSFLDLQYKMPGDMIMRGAREGKINFVGSERQRRYLIDEDFHRWMNGLIRGMLSSPSGQTQAQMEGYLLAHLELETLARQPGLTLPALKEAIIKRRKEAEVHA